MNQESQEKPDPELPAPEIVEEPGEAAGRPNDSAKTTERITAGIYCLLFGLVVTLALVISPDPSGVGTHTQLGLPPCGMLERTGRPCPTCGATTSFVLAAHGRFWESLVNQPFGFSVFLVTVGAFGFSIYSLVVRRSWLPVFERYHVVAFIVIMVVILFLSWSYKWWLMSYEEGAA